MRAGRFRQDVYYRLNEFGIALPPLRERDDILYLANELLQEANVELGRPCRSISEAAAQVLLRYRWPGNVRELRNVIRRAILLASDVIEPEHLSVIPVDPPTVTVLWGEPAEGNSSLKEIAETAAMEAEERAIRRVLQSTGETRARRRGSSEPITRPCISRLSSTAYLQHSSESLERLPRNGLWLSVCLSGVAWRPRHGFHTIVWLVRLLAESNLSLRLGRPPPSSRRITRRGTLVSIATLSSFPKASPFSRAQTMAGSTRSACIGT